MPTSFRKRRDAAGHSLDTSGRIKTVAGEVVGSHPGIEGYTIGQRKGLGVALGEPAYVVKIDANTNEVILGSKSDLERRELFANQANWLVDVPTEPFTAQVQIRYNSGPIRRRSFRWEQIASASNLWIQQSVSHLVKRQSSMIDSEFSAAAGSKATNNITHGTSTHRIHRHPYWRRTNTGHHGWWSATW